MREMSPAEVDARMNEVLARVGAFFVGEAPVQMAARAVAHLLEQAGIDYAVAGALALGFHGAPRTTEDVDVLVTREGLERFKAEWLGRGYVNLREGGKPVRDTIHNVKVDFLLTGEFPGDGKPKPIAFPDPKAAAIVGREYRVIALPRLIEMKLASGMTAPHRGHDLTDIQRLIHETKIPRDFASQLDPYVRAKFDELWQLAQHPDDEY